MQIELYFKFYAQTEAKQMHDGNNCGMKSCDHHWLPNQLIYKRAAA
jgi:hypothetical protein